MLNVDPRMDGVESSRSSADYYNDLSAKAAAADADYAVISIGNLVLLTRT